MRTTQHLIWNDIEDCVAILSPFVESTDQCCILIGGKAAAILLLERDGTVATVDHYSAPGEDPCAALRLAIERTIAAHKRASVEGSMFV